ncbi:glutamyl-tRNA synthetase [Stachybotrys elegans]|uniref:glutamate--tRNA ligase n=1 Tax=Stachybotrys elegans TaxID=80388 RepID=A0A8K0SS91_9HYPO|nr:glutamyl-tRNA synthetase [Stachybotrys elegans]
MKQEELQALEGKLDGDFRSMEGHLRDLDKHLTLRSYLEGYSLGATETKIWQALRKNKVAIGFIRRNGLPNLSRWFNFIEQTHPEIQEDVKAADAAAKAKTAAASKAGASYNLALQDTDKGVVTRFLPEPSGYLHIGHAKAALLSDYFGHVAYPGKMRLRLDDTNPITEREEYQDAIIEDLALMGIKPDVVTYTSDYFDYLYDMCIKLITMGKAYADDTDQETMRAERMDGIPSKRRERTVEENLRIFEEMKKGSEEGVAHCMRAKLSFDDPNKAMRDPVIYRCNIEKAHHRTGRKWNMYPMYDFACPVVDSYEGVTHALRSTEYTDRNPQYQWFLDTLGLRTVHMWDFARMNFVKTFLSKRKLAKLVDTGKVWGWDDPRMPTVRGVRRRGMTIAALRDFIIKQGPSRNVVSMEWSTFWNANKKEIDPIAPRHTALLQKDMVKINLTGADVPAGVVTEERPKHPKNPSVGTKQVKFSSSIYIDQADAKSFKDNEEVTLMTWGNAFVRELSKEDTIKTGTFELNVKGDFKSTEKKITWLSAEGFDLVPAELWEFDYLITKDKLEEEDNLEDFLNPNTASMELAWCDEGVGQLKADDIIQLERRGFFRVDKGLNDWKEGEAGEKGPRVVLFGIPTGKGGK